MVNVSLDLEAYKKALARTYVDFYALGLNTAQEQMREASRSKKSLGKAVGIKTNPQTAYDPTFSINWDTWTPGNESAALLLNTPGGLKKLLGDINIQSRSIGDTTHDLLGTALADGIAKGWTPEDIADSLGDFIADPSRALTIAITEGQRAKIEANVQSYADNGVEQVEWTVNAPDDIDCIDNDGQIVNLGDEFNSGDTQPPVHPNCQCDLLPLMPDMTGYGQDSGDSADQADMAVVADLAKYSPDQERDERGRFGSGSSGSSTFRDTREAGAGKTISEKQAATFGHGSAAPYLVSDGKGGYQFTAERQALHDQIIANALKDVPKSDNPTLHMLGGGPASGKSTMLGSGKVDVPQGTAAVQVNADDVKEQLPEYAAMVAAGDPRAAMYAHEESSYLAKEIQAQAYAGGHDIVLDGTGNSSVESLQGKIDAARANGYQVVANYATVPTNVAVERANARAEKTGRVVPESVVREIHASVSSVFPQAAGSFDKVNLWDNTGRTPVLLATGGGGSLTVMDQGGYQAFLDKRG
jgi:predicted ABC-type ATPase